MPLISEARLLKQAGLLKKRGLAYWYALFPVHRLVFAGMSRNIARAAARQTASEEPAPIPVDQGRAKGRFENSLALQWDGMESDVPGSFRVWYLRAKR